MQQEAQRTTAKIKIKYYRGVAQLVARDIWDVDAAGSNPVTPPTFPADLIYNVKQPDFFMLDLE